ncbi:MAG: type II toxin-antitoxin system RelE/ParE family toxin [Bacteroidia bacterium]|nr:type II toxin-antitoxin system RelE/ParE family toxin [Bacteroidia bacterium]MCF8427412.1 type II toxin-antitoxin system RelE/ParE family toxin [Bacteroidia bacterium]MCF8447289.1 type II toxin-antitoxin system RelE/ParE family toxin [Bacteroidia bacterium]
MKYSVSIKKSAAKSLESLPNKAIRLKVTNAILGLAENPRPLKCKKLKGKLSELWRIRIGNFRVIYSIDDTIRIIDIMEIGDRKEIYD